MQAAEAAMFGWKSKTQRCLVLDSASGSYTNVLQRLDLQKNVVQNAFGSHFLTFFSLFSFFLHIFQDTFSKCIFSHFFKHFFHNLWQRMWQNVFWKCIWEKCETHVFWKRENMWKNRKDAGAILIFFGSRAACCLADLCHKRFGDNCLGGLSGHGATGIWIGLKIGYHQNGY